MLRLKSSFLPGLCVCSWLLGLSPRLKAQPAPWHNLKFEALASQWDDGIPLGNGWLGALIWKKDNHLRISLDRVDLWDDRPMPELDKLRFGWVVDQVRKGDYDTVQRLGDHPYEKYPAPTKIPGAALEFDLTPLGTVVDHELDLANGLHAIRFANGIVMHNYIHATRLTGYFSLEHLPPAATHKGDYSRYFPQLRMPAYYTGKAGTTGNSVEGQGLERLGYPQGTVLQTPRSITYHQPTFGNNYYEVLVQWTVLPGNRIIGQWTISWSAKAQLPTLPADAREPTGWDAHLEWWNDYWSRSSVQLPDSLLERQYYLEMYKFGCVARNNTPPISLQAIWTADNGNLPPWKGDFHHDLNTQLSYWPGYTGNHLDLTAGYTNWLWNVREQNKKWTRNYFGLSGLNVPGVTTISGKEMGGWIQYSTSPTTAAWLAQHFYWQWKYSMDEKFLRDQASVYYTEVDLFLSQLLQKREDGKRHLPLSSSPEYHDNSIRAWFRDWTNHDLSLVKFFYTSGAEVAAAAYGRRPGDWIDRIPDLPGYATDSTGLMVAVGQPLQESHRHHAHLMSIHPLGLLSNGPGQKDALIAASLRHLEKTGTRMWCGYSFSWAACIYARARESHKAMEQLQIFARNFCAPNSFHLNGDQRGGQYSNFTYRPFTLEGNFAFAQGVHELLLQSHQGYVDIFPAVPDQWKNVSFTRLRAEGAVLVSARRTNGRDETVELTATVNGKIGVRLPFQKWNASGLESSRIQAAAEGLVYLDLRKGEIVRFVHTD